MKTKCNLQAAVYVVLGICCGIILFSSINRLNTSSLPNWLYIVGGLLIFVISLIMQTLIHEVGHMIFAFISGYEFISFRIGSLMLIKNKKGFRICKYSLPGTIGQCLMRPRADGNGKFCFTLYNMGGVIMNTIAAAVCFFAATSSNNDMTTAVLLLMGFSGAALALTNGIPMDTGLVNNDGKNAVMLKRCEAAKRSFYIQLIINSELSNGTRLNAMPNEWFEMSIDDAKSNSLSATILVFECNKLMDSGKIDEARCKMSRLLKSTYPIAETYKNMMLIDLIYCEAVRENRCEEMKRLLDKNTALMMHMTAKLPSVIRTQYAYALLFEQDMEKANDAVCRFEKVAYDYPYKSEIDGERELIKYANRCFAERQIPNRSVALPSNSSEC